MQYEKYQKSRNLAWQILINHEVCKLPVKVSMICRSMGYNITSYAKSRELIEKLDLSERTEKSDGFTCNGVIFYNEQCAVQRQRFTVAHELGHILLHNGSGIYNREPSANDNPIEHEANVFASRLLAPACVLWGLGITNAHQIADICDISMQSAAFRMERMQELYDREKDFIQRKGESCFLMSPLEKAVYEQFRDYIEYYKLLPGT